jgi:N-hydroxyarylamine O-acetyltransferase
MTKDGLDNYLERIDFKTPVAVSPECLFQLQKQHLLNVPFENLDIHLHRPILLDVNEYYKKIVLHHRGGFCYELNGLFNELLKKIGFETALVSCRPYNSLTQMFNQEFDHLAMVVTIGKSKWLVDVGFGEFSLLPIAIEKDIEQYDERNAYRIIELEDGHLVQRKTKTESWINEYVFSEKPRQLSEFAVMCKYHQSSPQSHFTQNRVCSKLTPEGRITLSDKKLKLTQNEQITEIEVRDDGEFRKYLKIYFGIDQ